MTRIRAVHVISAVGVAAILIGRFWIRDYYIEDAGLLIALGVFLWKRPSRPESGSR